MSFKLVLEFDGSGFYGWQRQPRHRTVQGELESALDKILGGPVTVYGCSRTDAGVSARNYVAGFSCGGSEPLFEPGRLSRALNYYLPDEILVKSIERAQPDFHPRHSAKSKTYEYRMVRGRSPLRSRQSWELRFPVDSVRMRRALRVFAGRHDFRAFCHLPAPASGSAFLPVFCRLYSLSLAERDDEILVIVKGDRFVYKMVRRIVGAAVAYGAGGITLSDIRNAMAGRKHQPFRTAPACGLVLDSVEY